MGIPLPVQSLAATAFRLEKSEPPKLPLPANEVRYHELKKPPASQHLKADAEGREKQLLEVAREFEALFINTLLKAMRKTVIESDIFNPQGESKYYRQLHDEELARAMSRRQRGVGVAQLIVNQFAARMSAEKAYTEAQNTGTELATPASESSEP